MIATAKPSLVLNSSETHINSMDSFVSSASVAFNDDELNEHVMISRLELI